MADEKEQSGKSRGVIGRLIEDTLAGGASAAIPASIPGAVVGPAGAAVVVTGGAVLGLASGVRREAFPTTAERLDPAEIEATHDAARRVAGIEATVDKLVVSSQELHAFAGAVAAHLKTQREARTLERLAEVGRMLLRLVADGHADAHAFDGDHSEAVIEAVRFALDALRPEAVAMIARLAPRPVDHFFRVTCRVLVDLDRAELAQLVALTANVAKKLEQYPQHANGDLQLLTRTSGTGCYWNIAPSEGEIAPQNLDGDSAVVRLLIAHRLARDPIEQRVRVLMQSVGGFTDAHTLTKSPAELLTMTITTILDLHFVLSGERIADPRTSSPLAER